MLLNHINDNLTVCVAYAKPLHVLLAGLLLYTSSSELYIIYFYFYFLSSFSYLFFRERFFSLHLCFSVYISIFFCMFFLLMYSLSIFGVSKNSVVMEEEKKKSEDMNSSRLANLLGSRNFESRQPTVTQL